MTITIELSSAAERRLNAKAKRQGTDSVSIAAKVLEQVLAQEEEEYEDAVAGIARGLDDFDSSRYRDFSEFAREQRQKYNITSSQ